MQVRHESRIVTGHVLDVAKAPLLQALRSYDEHLYVKWNPKKREGRGAWELRRKPEFKTVREGRYLDSPRGRVFLPGDIYEFDGFTLAVPKYNETSFENHVKDFDYLTYDMVTWVAKHDLWGYGFRGKYAMKEAEYKEAKFDEKLDEDIDAEHRYNIKQHRTQFNDFRAYINAGGDPYALLDHWGK